MNKNRIISLLFLIFLFSCSSPSGEIEKENVNYDSVHLSQISQAYIIDSIARPSDDLKTFLAKAKKIKFVPFDTAHKFTPSDHQNYFGVVNMPNTFAEYHRTAMAKAKNSCIDLVRNPSASSGQVHVFVEEWIFENDADAKQIDEALTAPLVDKRMERFGRFPFTFWRVHERMYYVYTANEQDRGEMDKVSNLLIKVLSPDQ